MADLTGTPHTPSGWNDFWTAIGALGQVAGAFFTYLTARVMVDGYISWTRPRLKLVFHDADVVTQDNTVGSALVPANATIRIVRASVEVLGNNLEKCRAHLLSITPDIQGYRRTGVRELGWEHSKQSGLWRDVLPGVPQRIDIACLLDPKYAPINKSALRLFTDPPYLIENPGEYIFEIQVTGEKLKAQRIKIKISWSGDDFNSITAGEV